MSEPRRYLFIITRDLAADASAQYVLRRALAAHRRGAAVTIVLRNHAAACLSLPNQHPLVNRMLSSGATLFVQDASDQVNEQDQDRSNLDDVAMAALSDDELGDMLLTPGVEAHWC